VALTTGEGITGEGLGLDAGVVDAAANVDAGAALGVPLGVDGAGAHAEPSKTMAINQQRIRTSIPTSCASCACSAADNAYGRPMSYCDDPSFPPW
jgi:hypothetical protein